MCNICEDLIPEERMIEVPNATKCVKCKEKDKLGLT
jgi:RNA polymerase-binding transcription factor DksA